MRKEKINVNRVENEKNEVNIDMKNENKKIWIKNYSQRAAHLPPKLLDLKPFLNNSDLEFK